MYVCIWPLTVTQVKTLLYDSLVLSMLLYSADLWPLTVTQVKKLLYDSLVLSMLLYSADLWPLTVTLVKKLLYDSLVLSMLLYSADLWPLTVTQVKKLEATHHNNNNNNNNNTLIYIAPACRMTSEALEVPTKTDENFMEGQVQMTTSERKRVYGKWKT